MDDDEGPTIMDFSREREEVTRILRSPRFEERLFRNRPGAGLKEVWQEAVEILRRMPDEDLIKYDTIPNVIRTAEIYASVKRRAALRGGKDERAEVVLPDGGRDPR